MATTAQQAYDAIKKLEANNTFPLPAPNKTVHVGNFDAVLVALFGLLAFAAATYLVSTTANSITRSAHPGRRMAGT